MPKPIDNKEIAATLDQIANLLEFKNSNPFRVRAYRKGARTINDLPESVSGIINDPVRKLTDVDGIGKDLAAKCATLIETGKLPMLDELLEDVPKSVLDLLRVPGLGPKKAAAVFNELQVTNLDQLREACESHSIRNLSGFGAKTEQAILDGLAIAAAASKRLLWVEADRIVQQLRQHFKECSVVDQLEFAGSYRRGQETVGDLDVLVSARDSNTIMDHFAQFPEIASETARGETKMSVRLESGFQIDLRVVTDAAFGAALQYFTGSKGHNVVLRGRAKRQGLRINEYGVFSAENEDYLAGRSEDELYASMNLPTIPPELREGRSEFEWADRGELPELIQLDDIQGDLHMHTTATDGKATIEQMVAAAKEHRLKYVAITDHSQRVSMARGLDPTRLLQQWARIDELRDQGDDAFDILKGIECDILESGGMDLPDDVLAQADWVLASVHYGQRQSRQQITERILEAIENPYVTAIAHPTGRLLNRREAYDVDLSAVYRAASQYGKLLELNANPRRLDLNDVNCAAAKQHGIRIVINTDAHSPEGLSVMKCGIQQARRAGLTKQDVANTKTWKQLRPTILPRPR